MKRILLFIFVVLSSISIVVFLQNKVFSLLLQDEKKVQKEKAYDYRLNSQYTVKNELYNMYETKDVNIVMLGDSLTNRVAWNELLNYKNIVNRGIDGDTTEGFLNRLDSIIKLKPQWVFIMGGINDMNYRVDVDGIFENYKKIIKVISDEGIKPVVQSTLYTQMVPFNKKVTKLNELLEAYCIKNKIDYIELNSVLSKDSFLNDEFTSDGLHLNSKAYLLWSKEIKSYLFEHAL